MSKYLKETLKEQKRLESVNVKYIYEHKNALNSKYCKRMIEYIDMFKDLDLGKKGVTYDAQDKDILSGKVGAWKQSYDIYINEELMEGRDVEFNAMVNDLHDKIFKYINYYCSYVGLYGKHDIGVSYKDWSNRKKKMWTNGIEWEGICLRKYSVGEAFNKPHFDKHLGSTRLMAGLIYLNTIKEGGQTYFPIRKEKVEATQGKLVIFPSNFTHVHYSIPPAKENRYIIAFHVRYKVNE